MFTGVSNFIKRNSEVLIYLGFVVGFYLLFFFPVLNKGSYMGGSDFIRYFYPSRYYLWETLKQGDLPFWTERVFSGYPIYADSERTYLNPVTLFSVYLLGPLDSYKLVHFVFYIAGSLTLYSFLRSKGYSIWGSITANLIFYFSFFFLYHQQHLNLTLTFYLIPAGLFLLDRFAGSFSYRWIIGFSLLTALLFYFGSYQSVVLFLLFAVFYVLTYLVSALTFRQKFSLLRLFTAVLLIVILPQLFPTLELYLQSSRSNNQISYLEGSYHPFNLVNAFYPYFFQKGEVYRWNVVNSDFLIHETYFYVGITAIVVAVLGFIKIKESKLRNFLLTCVAAFLFFAFLEYIPFIPLLKVPLLSMFRYWSRSSVFLVFAVALSAGYFFDHIAEKRANWDKNVVLVLFGLALFFATLLGSALVNERTLIFLKLLKGGAFSFNTDFFVWILLLTAVIAVTFFRGFGKFKQIVLLGLIFSDLYYFGAPIIRDYMRTYGEIVPLAQISRSALYDQKRVIYLDGMTAWNYGLYLKSWGIWGYSQFVPKVYEDHLAGLGVTSLKTPPPGVGVDIARELGVSEIVPAEGSSAQIASIEKSLFPKLNGNVSITRLEEGFLEFQLDVSDEQLVVTRVRNFPGWSVKVNGDSAPIAGSKEEPYVTFKVPQGRSVVTMRFIPKALYTGIALSALMFLAEIPLELIKLKRAKMKF